MKEEMYLRWFSFCGWDIGGYPKLILPYLFAEEIAFGVQKPHKSKLGKICLIYTFLIFFFGGTLFY
ncbi:hypothetical protein [Tenuibacillus multivorans]|uniref:Uncharacterized protein n=1 Tax=Tenuibacillus multivorans TaxID=237069 RepID=A0A1G9WJ23_9BACI|nr:hypothetical protein [Tenuibacillus multivorans]GEL76474.1 hypothetical protein TMU01_07090 [Tenuibacillus multivorans]SDM84166.1 hypothetical protein SAMN05216498_0761 [Tenuibacillus multivorans]